MVTRSVVHSMSLTPTSDSLDMGINGAGYICIVLRVVGASSMRRLLLTNASGCPLASIEDWEYPNGYRSILIYISLLYIVTNAVVVGASSSVPSNRMCECGLCSQPRIAALRVLNSPPTSMP